MTSYRLRRQSLNLKQVCYRRDSTWQPWQRSLACRYFQLGPQDKNLTRAPSIDCHRASGKLKMLRLFIGILASNLVISSQASSQSLDQFERTSQFEKAMVAVDQIRSRKKLQCLISIRNRSLCECLSTNLPFTLHISNYVSIANQDKGTVDYGQLSPADKQSVDQCVADNH